MRISELVETVTADLTDWFVVDSTTGTRKFSFNNLLNGIKSKLNYLDFLEGNIPVEVRRNTFRGKNLGHSVTDAQYNEIAAGTFKGLFLGDYWEINNKIWRIVDFDYWLGTGDVECTTHHLVIMPDHVLIAEKMNDTATTAGGYYGSKMYQTIATQIKPILDEAFSNNHRMKHREYYTNAVTNGRPSGIAWYTSSIDIPNEIMMYGHTVFGISNIGEQSPSTIYTVDKVQLALMKAYPFYIDPHRESQWLRDVSSSVAFSCVGGNGVTDWFSSHSDHGVRPVFGLCKENLDTMTS